MWGKSVRLTKLAGFDIKIDASWLIIAALIIWSLSTGYFPGLLPGVATPTLVLAATLSMLGLFASLVLHELAHSVVARHYGLKIDGITLFLFGGVAELATEPADPGVELRVAVVGPLASLALSVVFWSGAVAAGFLGLGEVIASVLVYLAVVNLVLALFNLIPAFPLDGGRVLRAVLWRSSGDLLAATRRAAAVSVAFAWALVGLGILAVFSAGPAAGLWPILVGLFLLAIGRATVQRVEMQHLTAGKTVADLMTRRPVTVRPDQSLADVVNQVFLANGISFAPVIEDGDLLGFVDLAMIRRIDREHWEATKADDVVEAPSGGYVVAPGLPVDELLKKVSGSGRTKFLVMEDDRLVGIVTMRDLVAYLDISRQIAA